MKTLVIYVIFMCAIAIAIPIMFRDELVMEDTGMDAHFCIVDINEPNLFQEKSK